MSRMSRNPILLLAVVLGLGSHAFASDASIVVSGSEQQLSGTWDTGSITISFSDSAGHAYSETVTYGQFSSQASIASAFGAKFSNDYVPSGLCTHAVGSVINFHLKGTVTFGSVTVSAPATSFSLAAASWQVTAIPPVITWPRPANISSGTPLSATQLNATANVPGVFVYLPGAGAVLEPGTQMLAATFTPTDTTHYLPAIAIVSLVVDAPQQDQVLPTITWATPAAISYGTPLSATQLNASASYNGVSVAGTFQYTPASGEILDPGWQTLEVAFTPSDTTQYSPTSGSVTLHVTPSYVAMSTIYSYSITNASGGSGYDYNGNIQSYTDSVTGSWSNLGYDSLNRLSAGTQLPVSGLPQSYCWTYDSFGNRTAQAISNQPFTNTAGATACQLAGSATLLANTAANFDASNRMTATSQNPDQANGYDAAGNVTNDGVNSYLYDAEGRICAVANSPVPGMTTMTEYIYDAEGNRVAKGTITNWSAGCDTTQNGFTVSNSYVLGPSNEQLTETDGNGNWKHTNVYAAGMLIATYNPSGLYFHLSDWLGNRRVQTDYAGNNPQFYQSLPFGEMPLGQDLGATEHHFTGKERDTESGNDYFGARYYGSSMGRFMSPDDGSDSDPSDPQSWNLYPYVRNNPLINTDPDGNDCVNASNAANGTILVQTTQNASDCKAGFTYVNGTVGNSYTYSNGQANFNISKYADGSGIDANVTMTVGNRADPDTTFAATFGSPSAQTWTNANGAVTDATIGVAATYGTLGLAAFASGGGGAAVALNLARMGRVAAATLAAGQKVSQQIARTGVGSPAALLEYAKNAMTSAVQAGTVVQATFGTIYRDGGNYIVQNAQGVITSVVVNAEAGKGIVSTYFSLGGK